MKKIISLLIITVLMISMVTACQKKPAVEPPIEEKPPVSNEIENEAEKEEENKVEVPKGDGEFEDKGMFLGMDDSNFVVIFSSEEKKDVHYKIAPSLNFKDSDIELGSAVKYRYTVSKTDEKTITHIEAVK